MADTAPFSDGFRQRFNPQDIDGVTVLSVRGRPSDEQFEDLRLELEIACRAGWPGVVCDVRDLGDTADVSERVGDLARFYTALCRAGAIFNFLHVERLIQHWVIHILPLRSLFFENQADAIADVHARCAATSR